MNRDVIGPVQDRRVVVDRRQTARRQNAVSLAAAAGPRACQPLEPRRAGSQRTLPLTRFVSARDVQEAIGCSRTLAYRHLAEAALAAGRTEKQKHSMLRVPVLVWERYAERTFPCITKIRGSFVAGERTGASVRSGTAGSMTHRGSRSAGPRSGPTGELRHASAPDGSATRLSRVTRSRATPSS